MRTSKTPSSGTERARKRRKGFLKRVKQSMNEKDKGLVLFVIGVTAFFGAGIADVTFPDVIPMRPYSSIFVAGLAFRKRHGYGSRSTRKWMNGCTATMTSWQLDKQAGQYCLGLSSSDEDGSCQRGP